MKDTMDPGAELVVPDNTSGTVFIRVSVPDLGVHKCLQFQLEQTVWQAKSRVLTAFAKDLRDPLNYGLYLLPSNGRAGKFLEEERLLSEYPIQGPIGFLEFKYKKRVYKMLHLNERKLKQLHTKSKLKLFLELVRTGNSDKLNKMALKGVDPNFHDQDNGETPLTIAVTLGKSKCREVIITLVSGGAHLDFRNRQGQTALHRSAIVGNAEAIRTLLDLGASPDVKDGLDLTPLYYSVCNEDAAQECTHMLLHERARIGMCDANGWYEIHQACKHGRVQHLEHLLFYGADMDVRNSCGNTPLHVCALNGQEACARVLMFRGADPTLLNYTNQTADQAATIAGNLQIADLILAHNPDDVVPYREIPQYSQRRQAGGSLTPSLRALIRCRSDPRVNWAGLRQDGDARSPSSTTSSSMSPARWRVGQNGAVPMMDSDSACSVSVSSTGSGTGGSEIGPYNGRHGPGRGGYIQGGVRRAGSMGDVNLVGAVNQRNTLATLVRVDKDQLPRVVLLHRSSEGYGFVLRGAKSKLPTGGGFNDFAPTAEYPALQYLDSVDPGSQADRAGLKSGDFILEINNENVVRASHEHVVHLIRSSSDVLTLKVITVASSSDRPPSTPASPQFQPSSPVDWRLAAQEHGQHYLQGQGYHVHPDSGAMTLPSRKKQAAPLPPQRDPRTSLSYSKGNSKSMAEGLAEIEKLDAAIAEFEGQESVRRHSLHGLLDQAGDPKIASVRASHSAKRVSVVDYDELLSGDQAGQAAGTGSSRPAAREYISPAEARIKKYHKKTPPPVMERARSTPNLAAAMQDQPISSNGHLPYQTNGIITGNGPNGSWSKSKGAPAGPNQGSLQPSPYTDASRLMVAGGAVVGGRGLYQKPGSGSTTPELPDRLPVSTSRTGAPGGPPTPEVVRINTSAMKKSATTTSAASSSNGIYANVSGLVGHGSSFRPPPTSTASSSRQQESLGSLPPPPEHTILKTNTSAQNRRQQQMVHQDGIITEDGSSGSRGISFADERVMEHAHQFIKKHPSATLLVTADIHASPEHGQDKGQKDDDVFEPEPDYEQDSEEEGKPPVSASKQVVVSSTVPVKAPVASSHSVSSSTSSSSIVRQNRGSVTVISISSDKGKPAQSPSNSVVVATGSNGSQSPAQPGPGLTTRVSPVNSLASSRRSSAQSGYSGSDDVTARETSFFTAVQAPAAPPPPPPGLPPPPPPPLPDYSPGGTLTLRGRREAKAESASPKPALPSQVSQEDILAAVANRKSRIETVGPKVSVVKAAPIAKTSHELNQEALLAAVAKRKSRMESEDKSVVEDIEAKLNRNKKLQAAKFSRSSSKVETNAASTSSAPVAAAPATASTATASASVTPSAAVVSSSPVVSPKETKSSADSDVPSPREILSRFEPKKAKGSPAVLPKVTSSPTPTTVSSPGEQNQVVDFRSRLKPVAVSTAGKTSPVAVSPQVPKSTPAAPSAASKKTVSTTSLSKSEPQSTAATTSLKAAAPTSASKSTAVSAAADLVSSPKTNSSKAPAPPPPGPKSTPPPSVQPKTSSKPGPAAPASTKSTAPSPGPAVQAKQGNGAPPASPTGSAADYIALAEKARLEYLKKKASGNMVGTVSKKGPVEITPMGKKNSSHTELSKGNQKAKTNGTTPVTKSAPQPSKANGKSPANPAEMKSGQNGNVPVKGVTVDHSYTEQAVNGGRPISPPPGLIPPPPVGFQDVEDSASPPSIPRGVVIDIVPPPSSFDVDLPSPPPPPPVSTLRQEDAASLVSSVSSLSTLSSEHGNSPGLKTGISIEDMIAPPPPPPPAFEDDVDINDNEQISFIPPPPQFLEIDANANESKSLDKNSRPFADKSVGAWSCLDVLDWLDSLGLPQYRTSFAKAKVDGAKLLDMGRTEFIALGVTQVGHRMNLERSVKKLNIAASTNL